MLLSDILQRRVRPRNDYNEEVNSDGPHSDSSNAGLGGSVVSEEDGDSEVGYTVCYISALSDFLSLTLMKVRDIYGIGCSPRGSR